MQLVLSSMVNWPPITVILAPPQLLQTIKGSTTFLLPTDQICKATTPSIICYIGLVPQLLTISSAPNCSNILLIALLFDTQENDSIHRLLSRSRGLLDVGFLRWFLSGKKLQWRWIVPQDAVWNRWDGGTRQCKEMLPNIQWQRLRMSPREIWRWNTVTWIFQFTKALLYCYRLTAISSIL